MKLGNDRIMYVLLLLAQKVVRDRVERVGAQFIIALDSLQKIELETTIEINCLVLARAKCLGREPCVLGFGFET